MLVKPSINPETGKPYKIRMPERGFIHLPDEGGEVPDNRFWRAHLKDGSVEIVKPAVADKSKKGAE
jgi:hypothetical protein